MRLEVRIGVERVFQAVKTFRIAVFLSSSFGAAGEYMAKLTLHPIPVSQLGR